MNTELLEALTILEEEKDISRDTLMDAIENSLINAHAKLPSTASAIVSAGLKEAPEASPKINAGSRTARPQANVI